MAAGHVTELNKSLESLENEMILTHPLTHSPHLTSPHRLASPHLIALWHLLCVLVAIPAFLAPSSLVRSHLIAELYRRQPCAES